eukprot:CAMPEP_0170821938 /NCGR_PEP_ID=MMETSP0733-20121128/43421_1 /TAXON_ID=186038 /ORGANISM="Fragilariopsis kerguelensis, Strain L26-C5" /LENGTH=298 /DNA_ID=CAMNT_0011183921 /DNA_START=876 /DNA_END=1772 /DNA_ORIENTATION=-
MKFTAIATTLFLASASAFAPASQPSTTTKMGMLQNQAFGSQAPPPVPLGGAPPAGGFEMFSPDIPMKRIEGGGTVRTWDIPPETERLQYVLETNGRPLKAKVELWEGPVRLLHSMDVNLEDGSQTPYKGMLAFPKGQKALKISTTGSQEFPCTFGAEVPSFDRTKQLMAFQNDVWDSNPKHTMQGNVNEGGLGAVKAFPISDNIESVQIMWWSKDTGKRSCKSKIEVLQGPNSIRQVFDLHCEGSTQPYHAIIETPGTGWTIRMWSKNPMEYPHEIVVEPHTVSDNGALSGGDSLWWE